MTLFLLYMCTEKEKKIREDTNSTYIYYIMVYLKGFEVSTTSKGLERN